MCDQTEVSYLEDDVVWVKIGPIWWPGVVKDLEKDEEGRDILAGLKKKPIAVVKFFQEDNYEFVKNLDCIYHYNCSKKDEFIKKGLDKFRTGATHMKKFPADITTAESLTNGDVNIINDPKFLPEKKESYSEIFGSGKKKTKKDSEGTPRSRGRPPANVTPYRPITHQRFINKALHGESDHKVKTLIQTNAASDDSPSGNPYKCHICKFETSRVNVIVAHHRLVHSSKNSINWTDSDSKLMVKKPMYKARKMRTKKLFDTSMDDYDEDEVVDKKKSPKGKGSKEKAKASDRDKGQTSPSKRKGKEDSSADAVDSKKPRFTDVLLADWNEEDEGDDGKSPGRDAEADEDKAGSGSVDPADTNADSTTKHQTQEKMSCFDFDEEEEGGFIGMSNANTYGRKIPRVIPVKDKAELGMDLDMDDIFKKKNEGESETGKGDEKGADRADEAETHKKGAGGDEAPPSGITKRRRSRANKEEEVKINPEDSLALRRTRRPGAKKSYLNEVIEKVDEDGNGETKDRDNVEASEPVKVEPVVKPETTGSSSSSSRRKQDFKNQTMDSDREEMVYSNIVTSDPKPKEGTERKKRRSQNSPRSDSTPATAATAAATATSASAPGDDLTAQIDNLLEETKLPNLPTVSESSATETERKSNTTNFSFDYVPAETKKVGKVKVEQKSISKMFSDSIPSADRSENESDASGQTESGNLTRDGGSSDGGKVKGVQKSTPGGASNQKRGSIVLSTLPKAVDSSSVKLLPVTKQANASKDCIVLPAGKQVEVGDGESVGEGGDSPLQRVKNIKTIKVKSDSLPSSLLSAGKLKGQTIIHQKSGKYVIVTQPPQLGRQRVTPGKVQSGSKVVIFTNQHGEQKIITTSGLQQTKFKVDGQKLVAAATSDSAGDKDVGTSSASTSQSPSQPVIKMVPDGKGGIMKQLTVSPKKVLLGGTKVLVSGSGTTFSAGNSVQKIALSSGGGGVTRTGGDFRLIENYKGSGKTVLIQGGATPASRQVTKVIQSPQVIPGLKKKPKILMRTSAGQSEYVMQTASGTLESPAYVVKQKGADGKFSAQKIVRTEIVNQGKVGTHAGTPTKKFILSGQGPNKKGESYIITTNEAVPSKVIRMRQRVKNADGLPGQTTPTKIVQKTPEVFAVGQNNSLLLPAPTTAETDNSGQLVQVQADQSQQQQQPVLQTQVIAMPGPVGADGNQTYVLVSVDEHGVVQGMDNSVVAYDASGQQDQIFVNSTSTDNVILLNPQTTEEPAQPVYSSSSQDILAEALANTNVLEGSINNDMDAVVPSILLPPSIPSSVVQETSITLQKPIMTPLEMPSSVAPDTSGLEPPPLPPTPTDEDVLMEESDIQVTPGLTQEAGANRKEPAEAYMEPTGSFDGHSENSGAAYQVSGSFAKEVVDTTGEKKSTGDGYQAEVQENGLRETEMESSSSLPQEEPTTNSYQSMPLLGDEPDTSEDTQGSEPIPDQQFEAQKSRMMDSQQQQQEQEQEPPSSTNHDLSNQSDALTSSMATDATPTPAGDVDGQSKETHSMPVIADDDLEAVPPYSDGGVQKNGGQEGSEVTSTTTDECMSKEVTN